MVGHVWENGWNVGKKMVNTYGQHVVNRWSTSTLNLAQHLAKIWPTNYILCLCGGGLMGPADGLNGSTSVFVFWRGSNGSS